MPRPPRQAANRRFRFRCRLALERLEKRLTPVNVDVLRAHYDNLLSGWNDQETALTLAAVNAGGFGKLFSQPVDGQVYAQPLYEANLAVPGRGTHDVVFVATEHDSVYAFDADSNQGADAVPLWQTSLIDPAHRITPVSPGDLDSCANIAPEVGVTGTPVIDAVTGTLYVVAKTREVRADGTHFVQRLHALDVGTGAEKFGGPYTIGDTVNRNDNATAVRVPGTGWGADGGEVAFNARWELQRAALQLVGGVVYVSWASHCDFGPYHGWVVGFDARTLNIVQVFNTSPNGSASGVWQSGGGLAFDGQNNLYFATGNGMGVGFDPPNGSWAESVLKLSTAGPPAVADSFTPHDWRDLDDGDQDLGSGGTMLLPDTVGSTAHRHLLVEAGKTGRLYVLDRDNLGGYTPGGPDRIVQTVNLGTAGVWGNPAFFQDRPDGGLLYYWGTGAPMTAFRVTTAPANPVSPNPVTRTAAVFSYPGAQPSVSSNGPAGGIVWALEIHGPGGRHVLHAYDALDLGRELYTSEQAGLRDRLGGGVNFTFPVVSNGHVFVGSADSLSVFGLFDYHTTPPAAPANLAAAPVSDTEVRLTWNNPVPNDATGIKVERSADGTAFTQVALIPRDATAFTDGGLAASTRYFYRVRAANQRGDSAYSNGASAVTRIARPRLRVADLCSVAVDLAWDGAAGDHYELFRSVDGGAFTRLATLPATQAAYADGTVTHGHSYGYYVQAFNATPPDSSVSDTVLARVGPVTVDYPLPGGFPDQPADLRANGSARFTSTTARLTDLYGQAGSLFTVNRVNVTAFQTTFYLRAHDGSDPPAEGMAFVLQADGPAALGSGAGGCLGFCGIPSSVAIKFDLADNEGEGANATGLFFNGSYPTLPHAPGEVNDPIDPAMVNLRDQHRKRVDLTYDGTARRLTETITDEQHLPAPTSVTFTYDVDLAARLGAATAYAGFTAATSVRGDLFTQQDVLGWTFAPTRPTAPVQLRAAVTAGQVTLTWACGDADADGFRVERSADGVSYAPLATTGPGVTTYQDVAVTPGKYFYRVRAFNTGGESANAAAGVIAGPTLVLDHSAGFADHRDLTGNQNPAFTPVFTDGVLQLTDGNTWEAASAFTNTRLGVAAFRTRFTFQARPVFGSGVGIAFVVQGLGPNALGGNGGGLGVSAVANSVAVTLDLFANGTHAGSTGLVLNGDFTGYQPLNLTGAGIDLADGHPFAVELAYDLTSVLTETITDTVSGAVAVAAFAVDIQRVVGGPTAFVGFTGATGGDTAVQRVLDWSGTFLDPVQPANHLTFGTPAGATAGTPFTVTISARDVFETVQGEYRGTVRLASSDPQATLPPAYTFTAADNGTHAFAVTLFGAGGQALTAQDTGSAYVRGVASVNVSAAVPDSLSLTGFPRAVTAGAAHAVTVAALDAYGNVATAYTGRVHFTSTDPQAALPADANLSDGVGVFDVALGTVGVWAFTVADFANPVLTATQAGVVVGPGSAAVFVVADFPSPTRAGQAQTFTVTARDAFGNLATGYRGTVTFRSSDPQAVLVSRYAFTAADNGRHSFGATLRTAGSQSVTALDVQDDSVTGTQAGIVVTSLAADHFSLDAPAPLTAGTPFDLTVTARDPYGNADPNYQGTVTFTSSDGAAVLPPDYTFTGADGGTHTFAGAAVLFAAGGQAVSAADTGSGLAGTATFAVVAAATDHLQIDMPATATAGEPFAVTMMALDPYGNVATGYAGLVHFDSTDGDPGAVLPDDYTFTGDDAGVHTFAVVLVTPGPQTVMATDDDGLQVGSSLTVVDGGGAPGVGGGRGLRMATTPAEPSSAPRSEAAADLAEIQRWAWLANGVGAGRRRTAPGEWS